MLVLRIVTFLTVVAAAITAIVAPRLGTPLPDVLGIVVIELSLGSLLLLVGQIRVSQDAAATQEENRRLKAAHVTPSAATMG